MVDPEDILGKVRRGEGCVHPDDRAPLLDDDLLRRYIRRQVAAEEAASVSRLLASFASWRERYLELLIESGKSNS